MSIKQLEWTDFKGGPAASMDISPHARITYTIQKGRRGRFKKNEVYVGYVLGRDQADEISGINFILEAAKAHCQQHFEEFVKGCIE